MVVLSSHDLNAIKQYCDQAIVMEKGEIVFNGTPQSCIDYYLNSVKNNQLDKKYNLLTILDGLYVYL